MSSAESWRREFRNAVEGLFPTIDQLYNTRDKSADVIFMFVEAHPTAAKVYLIPAHKSVLAAASKVLEEQFGMDETTNVYSLEDSSVSPRIFKDFLALIYGKDTF